MQLSAILKPVRRVMLHNHVTGEVYKGFEMELEGKLTVAIEEGSLKDEIERAGGIGLVAALTPSGTIQLKYIPFAEALSSEELEKRATERDEVEMENRKKQREAEAEDRKKRNEETMKDGIRMELSERKRFSAERAQETSTRTASATPPGSPSVSDDEVQEEFEKRQKENSKSSLSSEDIAESFSPIAGDIGADDKPLTASESKSKKTVRQKSRTQAKK